MDFLSLPDDIILLIIKMLNMQSINSVFRVNQELHKFIRSNEEEIYNQQNDKITVYSINNNIYYSPYQQKERDLDEIKRVCGNYRLIPYNNNYFFVFENEVINKIDFLDDCNIYCYYENNSEIIQNPYDIRNSKISIYSIYNVMNSYLQTPHIEVKDNIYYFVFRDIKIKLTLTKLDYNFKNFNITVIEITNDDLYALISTPTKVEFRKFTRIRDNFEEYSIFTRIFEEKTRQILYQNYLPRVEMSRDSDIVFNLLIISETVTQNIIIKIHSIYNQHDVIVKEILENAIIEANDMGFIHDEDDKLKNYLLVGGGTRRLNKTFFVLDQQN